MKEDKEFKELIDLIKLAYKLEKIEMKESSKLVDEIIEYKIEDENIISRVFDKMLSIAFTSLDDIKEIYYKLLKYTMTFNKELSNDYEEIFIDNFKELDDKKLIL